MGPEVVWRSARVAVPFGLLPLDGTVLPPLRRDLAVSSGIEPHLGRLQAFPVGLWGGAAAQPLRSQFQLPFQFVQRRFPPIGVAVTIVGLALPVVRQMLPLVGETFPFVGGEFTTFG